MKKQKPIRILCLHDENSSAHKMKMSMWPLLLKVEQKVNVEHVYLNSPLIDQYENKKKQEAEQKGQKLDKMPIKKGLGWYTRETYEVKKKIYSANTDMQNETKIRYQNIYKSLDLIREVLDRQGPFDGILGIGQGATLASLLCMKRVDLGQMHANKPYCFNFAILVEARSCNEDEQFEKEYDLALKYLKSQQKIEQAKRMQKKDKNSNSNLKISQVVAENKNKQQQQQKGQDSSQNGQDFMITQSFSFNQNLTRSFSQAPKNTIIADNEEESKGNDSTDMQSLHIYAKKNKSAHVLKEYFIKDKRITYQFETIDQRIPEREKQYFEQKGHEIKKNGPVNLILPSEVSNDYIKFLNKYQLTQTKKVVFKKPEVPKKQDIQQTNKYKEGDDRINTDTNFNQNEGGLFTDYNDLTKFKAQSVFAKAKKGCKVNKQYPCVYKLSRVALSKAVQKEEFSETSEDFNLKSQSSGLKEQFCDVCQRCTNDALFDLIQEGKRRLLPKMAFKNMNMTQNTQQE